MLTNEPDEKLQYACCVDNVGRKPNMQYDPPPKKQKKHNNKKLTHTETHNILWKPKKNSMVLMKSCPTQLYAPSDRE